MKEFIIDYPIYVSLVSLAFFIIGFVLNKFFIERKIGKSKRRAQEIIDEARKESQTIIKEGKLEAKEYIHQARIEFEKDTKDRRHELYTLEKRVIQKEENLDRKAELFERKEGEISKKEEKVALKEKEIEDRQKELDLVISEEKNNLHRISGLSKDEAKKELLQMIESDVKMEAAAIINRAEQEAKETAEKKARNIISLAIQRCAVDHISDTVVSSVQLPNDEMKGRIIGREGRNIRALESATGINVIIDDTPEAVMVSGFDNIRKEIAKMALEKLILDGRIHPARIEEVVEKSKKEMNQMIKEYGEQAVFDAGIHPVHPEIVKLLGRLHFRTSYGQNVLEHSKESCYIMGVMAAELGIDEKMARRAGLLHDIGKAVDHEVEGPHGVIGADLAKKYKEIPEIVHAIRAHHEDEEPKTVLAVLLIAADAMSGARPGARSETLSAYIKRLENLESIARSFKGVEQAYAMQAGREIRVIVQPDKVDDNESVQLSRNISKRIESEMEYPGQIKVTVIRETRAIEYAK
ncbi:MAG: ribonuclease Y [Candidatus Aureabacteria bacterium]|nr:ribonuclease Y [Candidatus Auribacterota bacterium]